MVCGMVTIPRATDSCGLNPSSDLFKRITSVDDLTIVAVDIALGGW